MLAGTLELLAPADARAIRGREQLQGTHQGGEHAAAVMSAASSTGASARRATAMFTRSLDTRFTSAGLPAPLIMTTS